MRSLGLVVMLLAMASVVASHDYGDALSKSILFFDGQRSGKLPPSQRLTWRMDSALKDGSDHGVDLVGGYYDAGDNIKFHFPMAYSTTLLAWSVVEFGDLMQSEKGNALDALRWSTDYFLKATNVPGVIYAQVGDPVADHNCWERPEDMDTSRNSYAIDAQHPGSELAAEIAAAFAASSIAFRNSDPAYASTLLERAYTVFDFADNHRGAYNASWVCPFYCDNNGYMDELLWGAAWIYTATKNSSYLDYVTKNSQSILSSSFAEFGWDSKFAGVNVLLSQYGMTPAGGSPFVQDADRLVCSILPESPAKMVTYSPGGLMFKAGSSNMQHTTSLSFLLLVYAGYISRSQRVVQCGSVTANPDMLVKFARSQVDYILGTNPKSMSYMVGYGKSFPQRIHHRGSSLPSKASHPQPIACKAGTPYYQSQSPNPNLLTGAIVGGPKDDDSYADSRLDAGQSEPTTYMNAPLVGLLAYYKAHP